ncbi:MAG: glycosyltransferase [Anaerolineales bacterium]|nr:glycosyltransferase [Anaerolineales bacterium]
MSSSMPVVSVVIPNYNHAKFIGDAIQSVLNQSFRDFEIIVVDDGSTDDSRAVVARFGDRVRYTWQANSGLSAARNAGIAQARGEFIGVLDADDMYEPDFLSVLAPILQADPQAQAVYCGYRFVDEANRPLPQVEARLISPERLFQVLAEGNFLVPESILVRKGCYDAVGLFDVKFRACEDVDMWLRISRQFKILGVTNILTRHRILPNSMSTDPTRQTENRLAVIRKHFGSKPVTDGEWTEPQRRAYGRAYLASSVEYLQARMFDRAYESFCSMVRAEPILLTQLTTFYELGCGEQPKGYRGDFASLDLDVSARNLLNLLERFFMEDGSRSVYLRLRRQAYSQAYLALGLLNYGSRQFRDARKFLVKAASHDLLLVFDRRFFTALLKSFLHPQLVELYRGRHRASIGDPASPSGWEP